MLKLTKQNFIEILTLLEKGINTENKLTEAIVKQLELNGAIKKDKLRSRGKIRWFNLMKKENVFLFFRNNNYNISSIDEINTYIEEMFNNKRVKSTIQKYHNDTKAKDSKSLKGLYLSSLKNIDIKLNDEVLTITPMNGLGYFLFHTEKIDVSEDTIIVGIENYEVIWFAKKYAKFFSSDNILFVVRNSYMLEWISELENEYIHFGDYDLAGIKIYQSEMVPRLKKSKKYSMFIPENIEYLIKKHGLPELYEKQKELKDMLVTDNNVYALQKMINKHKKGLEQEGFSNF